MILRDLTTLDDFRRVVEIEKLVWGYTDAEDVVPVPILVVTVKRGAILIGAFVDDRMMVGFVYSLAGLKDGKPMQWSHMLGVLGQYRNSGLGHELKLAQRARALAMGLDLIEWTFDPLQALNAHLNFRKLGVVVEEYEENIYGDSSSPLHRGTPTDRFVAEWRITTPHVERRLEAATARTGPAGILDVRDAAAIAAPCVNSSSRPTGEAGWPSPTIADLECDDPRLWVEIPVGFTDMQAADPGRARAWRFETRRIFTTYFGRGYRAVDFLLDRSGGFGRYLLTRAPSP
jgi:predicted GNAT superfamily acetyltransferase